MKRYLFGGIIIGIMLVGLLFSCTHMQLQKERTELAQTIARYYNTEISVGYINDWLYAAKLYSIDSPQITTQYILYHTYCHEDMHNIAYGKLIITITGKNKDNQKMARLISERLTIIVIHIQTGSIMQDSLVLSLPLILENTTKITTQIDT